MNDRNNLSLRNASQNDLRFVYECLIELRGSACYSSVEFQTYVEKSDILNDSSSCRIIVATINGDNVGMMTCNYYYMPRYLGRGCEIEEIVVARGFRSMGYGESILKQFIRDSRQIEDLRHIVIKTDSHLGAGRLYNRVFSCTDHRLYSLEINRL